MGITVEPGEETAEIRQFIDLVWPPGSDAASPVAHIIWDTKPAFRIIARDSGRTILGHVAAFLRQGTLDGLPVLIGGIGHVGTHPDLRGRGIASEALREASQEFTDRSVDFGVLFCATSNFSFYARLSWRVFDGEVYIAQPRNCRQEHSGNCMTLDLRQSPRGGVLHLHGLPW